MRFLSSSLPPTMRVLAQFRSSYPSTTARTNYSRASMSIRVVLRTSPRSKPYGPRDADCVHFNTGPIFVTVLTQGQGTSDASRNTRSGVSRLPYQVYGINAKMGGTSWMCLVTSTLTGFEPAKLSRTILEEHVFLEWY